MFREDKNEPKWDIKWGGKGIYILYLRKSTHIVNKKCF